MGFFIQRIVFSLMQSMLFDLFIYNIRMARNQTVTGTVHNIFALNRVRKECYYQPIRVDFSPIQKPNHQYEQIIPFFNKDGNFFTPSFILKRQKISLEQNILNEKNKFEARITHSLNLKQEQTPEYKPTDNNYCQLCQEYFQDYWEHINGKYHKRMINSSKFNKDIMALCQRLSIEDQKKNPQKCKKITKRKNEKKVPKQTYSKNQDKLLKQNLLNQSKQKLKNYSNNHLTQEDLENINKKNIEQSLKITLQLGNYSTNILSNNTFKQLCVDS